VARIFIFVAAFLSAAVMTRVAVADPPTREPVPITPSTFTVSGACSFDVQFDVLVNGEVAKTFTNGEMIITGRLVVRLTNLSNPSKSIVVQINGPEIEPPDATAFYTSGSSLIFFPGILLTHGPVATTSDSITQTSASSVDLCAVLADP